MSRFRVLRAMPILIAATAMAAAALAPAAASASVRKNPAPGVAAATAAAPAARSQPAAAINESVLEGVSCAAAKYCINVGWAERNGFESGTSQLWTGGKWGLEYLATPSRNNAIVDPVSVSCGSTTACMTVGSHENSGGLPSLLAEQWNGFEWLLTQTATPAGTKWGDLNEVSCVGTSYCMAVGMVGTSKSTNQAQNFAEQWNGTRWHRLTVPNPPRATFAELGAVSCLSASNCVATGIAGLKDFSSYAAYWNGASWQLAKMPSAPGQKATLTNEVSCSSPGACIAAGWSAYPSSKPLAEELAAGSWTIMSTPRRTGGYFNGLSCPTATTSCMAVGGVGKSPLTESWNGKFWKALTMSRTTGHRNADVLIHVSCFAPTLCVAVGFSYWPGHSYTDASLAERWNGSTWKQMSS
jgi:hypothetical protein